MRRNIIFTIESQSPLMVLSISKKSWRNDLHPKCILEIYQNRVMEPTSESLRTGFQQDGPICHSKAYGTSGKAYGAYSTT